MAARYLTALILLLLTACSGGYRAPVADVVGGPRYWDTDRQHRVNAGETLYSVAWVYDIDHRLLAQVNELNPPYSIRPGELLLVDVRGVSLQSSAAVSAAGTGAVASAATASPAIVSAPLSTSTLPASRTASNTEARQAAPAPGAATSSAPVPVPAVEPGPWSWPASGQLVSRFSSAANGNKGLDIAGARGDPVIAAADGEVVYAGSGLLRYGDFIIVKHNERFLSAYAHNDRLLVAEGDRVTRGQKIAEMGSSGINEVKLHFEIREGGKPIDPQMILPGNRP